MPYLIKNSAGVWCVQRKVPQKLEVAVARVLGGKKDKQAYLKKSLGTKDQREAIRRAVHVLADLDRTLREAEALIKREPKQPKAPLRDTLNNAEIKRMAEYVYAKTLAWDERCRYGREEYKRMEEAHLRLEGRPLAGPWATPYEEMPPHGISPTQLEEDRRQLVEDLGDMREYLALGDISAVEDHINEALVAFQIDLDRQGTAYPKLGIEVLRAYVRALQAIEQRNSGEPVPTPQLVAATASAASGTLREAFEGWKKERDRPEGTLHEYGRAIEMFIQLHGNLSILEIKRSHARTYREALQLVPIPRFRKGALRQATLPALADYGRAHPVVQRVSPGTVNKQLGAVQAIARWGRHNGLVPEDAPWNDPFEEMRLEEEQSQREPFDARDLQTIFNAPLFTENELPVGAKGAAGIWLPLLALFAGARQAEYAGLRVSDIREDGETRVPLMWFTRDTKAGRRLKTKSSERVIPVHPQLIEIGFLSYVAERRKDGEQAWLFPTVAPDQKGALRAWAKWWGRHLRNHVGVKDTNKVFHSFRHGFQDALRQATPDEELRDALAGRSSGKSVSRRYGAKAMLERWGVKALKVAMDKIEYPSLDLSRVRPLGRRSVHAARQE
ncbi:DUF6538 domain-containing protein [Bradyrhizobium sp. USDA 4463]